MDKNSMKKLCLDFDGVIHQYSKGWNDGTIYDPPMPNAIEIMKKLATQYELIIFTTRKEHYKIIEWLQKYGYEYPIQITSYKIQAQAYIGKWNCRFRGDWSEILPSDFTEKEKEKRNSFIKEIPQISDSDWGYLGGLIDGEGCICTARNNKDKLSLRLIITNQHWEELEWIKELFEGSIQEKKKDDHFPVYNWNRQGIALLPIFKELLKRNVVRMKRKQVELGIEFLELQRYNGRKENEFVRMQKEQIKEGIHILNRYGFWTREPIYIDDRAVRFTNWRDIKNLFYSSNT